MTMRPITARLVAASLMLSTALPGLAGAEVKTLWTVDLPAKAKWQNTTQRGLLLVGADSGLSGVDPTTGKVLWTRSDLQKVLPFTIREDAGTSHLVITDAHGMGGSKTTLAAVDQTTGQNVWATTITGQNLGAYPDPERNQIILFATDYMKGAEVFVRAYDSATGAVKWQTSFAKNLNKIPMYMADNSGMFSVISDYSGHQDPVIDKGVMYVPFKGLDAIDLASGAIKWGHEFKTGHKTFKKAYPRPVIDNGVVYAGGQGALYAFDAASGAQKWTTSVKSGLFTEIVPSKGTVLARTGGQFYNPGSKAMELDKPTGLYAFDAATGGQVWAYSGMKEGITNVAVVGNTAVIADAKSMLGVDMATGGESFRTALEFKAKMGAAEKAAVGLSVAGGLLNGGLVGALQGGFNSTRAQARQDIPQSVQILDDGSLFVRGNFNAVNYNPAARTQNWGTQIAVPGNNALGVALLGATVAFTQVGYAGMSANYGSSYAKSAAGDTQRLAKVAAKRFVAAKGGQNNAYFLAKLDSGVGVIVLDTKTGAKKAEIPLGDKTPIYATDETASRVYHATDNGKLIAYGF